MPLNTKVVEFSYKTAAPVDSNYPIVCAAPGCFNIYIDSNTFGSSYCTNTPAACILDFSYAESVSSILYCVPSGRVAKVIPRKMYVSQVAQFGLAHTLSASVCMPNNCYSAGCDFGCFYAYVSGVSAAYGAQCYTRKFSITHGTADLPFYNQIQYSFSGAVSCINNCGDIGRHPLFGVTYSIASGYSNYPENVIPVEDFAINGYFGQCCCTYFVGTENKEITYLDYKPVYTAEDPGLKLADSCIAYRGGTRSRDFESAIGVPVAGQAAAELYEEDIQNPPGYFYLQAGDCIAIDYSRNISNCSMSISCTGVMRVAASATQWARCITFTPWIMGYGAQADTDVILSYLIIEEAAS